MDFNLTHSLRVAPSIVLESFGGFDGMVNKVFLQCLVEFVVDFGDFLGFVEFLDVVMEFEELHHVGLFEQFLIVFHDSLDVVLHLL